MSNLRKYGNAPFTVAVIHGGPGATGEMAPVAIELSQDRGVLEPLQTASSIESQVQELRSVLEEQGDIPVTLIGHSWGAWLSLIFAAKYPSFVKKLILIASGPLEEKYALKITETRLSRLTSEERSAVQTLMNAMADPLTGDLSEIFARFGELMSKADTYDPLPHENGKMQFRYDIFQNVWNEAEELRRNGELLRIAGQVQCPIVAIHGDYDPHPSDGAEKPMRVVVKDFRFILLTECGHEPWIERSARDQFFDILKKELT